MTFRRWAAYFVAMMAVWVVAADSARPAQLAMGTVGVTLTLPVVWRLLDLGRPLGAARTLARAERSATYFFRVFLPDALRSTWDVARRVVMPVIPMRPGILAVEVPPMNEAALLLLVDHVGLTPGQLVVDLDVPRGRLYVHTIDAGDPGAVRAHVRAVCRGVMEVVGP